MSGKHWLERDPSQSPGLRRIQEAQQAAVLAKTQEAQWAREAEMAKLETKQKRLEMIVKIEQRTAQVFPALEEIRNFANTTKSFPLGIISDPDVRITDPSRAEVYPEIVPSGWGEIQLQFGFKGLKHCEGSVTDFGSYPDWEEEKSVLFGIRLKVEPDKVLLFQRKEKKVFIPGKPSTGGRGGSYGNEPYTKVVYEEKWQELPNDETKLKNKLAIAFHDPVYLGTGRLPFRQEVTSQPDLQASAGISDLVKSLLGLK
jgi:hypothetical protein